MNLPPKGGITVQCLLDGSHFPKSNSNISDKYLRQFHIYIQDPQILFSKCEENKILTISAFLVAFYST